MRCDFDRDDRANCRLHFSVGVGPRVFCERPNGTTLILAVFQQRHRCVKPEEHKRRRQLRKRDRNEKPRGKREGIKRKRILLCVHSQHQDPRHQAVIGSFVKPTDRTSKVTCNKIGRLERVVELLSVIPHCSKEIVQRRVGSPVVQKYSR
jgi:hypothetical protein